MIGIFVNFILCCLIMAKLLNSLQFNEKSGLLSVLVGKAIRDSVPFLVFNFVWMLVLEVLFVALGAFSLVETCQYNDIHPFFGIFFYVFEQSIGNTSPP